MVGNAHPTWLVEIGMRVTTADDLDKIDDCIHDRVFSVLDVSYDANAQAVYIPFVGTPDAPVRGTDHASQHDDARLLTIKNVSSFELIDDEQIQWYPMNKLKYDKNTGVLLVLTSIPLTLAMVVVDVDVSVEPWGAH